MNGVSPVMDWGLVQAEFLPLLQLQHINKLLATEWVAATVGPVPVLIIYNSVNQKNPSDLCRPPSLFLHAAA